MTTILSGGARSPRLSRRTMLFGLALATLSSATVSCVGRAAIGRVSGSAAGPAVAVQPPANPVGMGAAAPANVAAAAPAVTTSNTASGGSESVVVANVEPVATVVDNSASPAVAVPTATTEAPAVASTAAPTTAVPATPLAVAPTATSVPATPVPVAPTVTSAPVVAARPTATAVPAPAAPPRATMAVVQMTDQFKFSPSTLTISRGTIVEWKDAGAQPHTITCDPAKAMKKSDVAYPSGAQPFDSGSIMGGQSFKHTFTVAGEYRYICVPHEMMGMIGTVIVT